MNEQLMTVRITDDHLRAIGRVTVQFSVLEMRIRYLVWRLMDCKPESVARLVTAELGFRQLVQLFSSLYKLRSKDKDELKKLKTLLKQIDGASKKRNEMIHSFWVEGLTVENAKRFRLEAKRKNGISQDFNTTSVNELEEIAVFLLMCLCVGVSLIGMGMGEIGVCGENRAIDANSSELREAGFDEFLNYRDYKKYRKKSLGL